MFYWLIRLLALEPRGYMVNFSMGLITIFPISTVLVLAYLRTSQERAE